MFYEKRDVNYKSKKFFQNWSQFCNIINAEDWWKKITCGAEIDPVELKMLKAIMWYNMFF